MNTSNPAQTYTPKHRDVAYKNSDQKSIFVVE